MLAFYFLFVIISLSNGIILAPDRTTDWYKPGCHKVGHTRKVLMPGCLQFDMTTNACRGFCESWSVPKDPQSDQLQPVTSVGTCCNMIETEQIESRVWCQDGYRTLIFNSAVNCTCFHCDKY